VLSAFALVGAMTMFTIGMLALRHEQRPARVVALRPAMRIAGNVVIVGVAGTIIFGIWLALSIDAYELWDTWIIIAIVLWAVGTETGRRSGAIFFAPVERAAQLVAEGKTEPDPELAAQLGSRDAWLLHGISTVAAILILADMIWKPGA
jgi:hypothetical protein